MVERWYDVKDIIPSYQPICSQGGCQVYHLIRSERLYERIVEQIQARILNGELEAGHQLPTERELAEQFGVSRTAVREAMKALAQSGLIEVRPGRGTFVIDGAPRAMKQSLGLVVRIGQAVGYADLIEIREMLEVEIAGLAARRATEEHIAAMQDAVAAMDSAMDDADAFCEADLDFHLALAQGTQNALIPMLIDPVVDLLRWQRMRIYARGGAARGQYGHKRILDAVVRHDPEAACEAMRAHLKQARQDSEGDDPPKGQYNLRNPA